MLGSLAFWVDWLSASLRLATPMILTGAGSVFTERSGVTNIGMEGMMLVGAFFSILGSLYTGSVVIGVLAGMLAGGLLSLIHAFMAVTLGVNQTISGQALNLMALGLTNVLNRALIAGKGRIRVAGLAHVEIPLLSDIPVLGPILFDHSVAVYLGYAATIIATWLMFNTTWGLTVRATGEYPEAVETTGGSVRRIRYLAVLVGGLMAGLGGAAMSLSEVRLFTPNMTAGRGFIVLAAIPLGKWNPALVSLACLLFGAADALQLRMQTFNFAIPPQFFVMVPYIVTIAALVGFVGHVRAPENLGKPYNPGR
jgi:ABC-type uncharacterized transport system permease subunit